MFSLEGNGEDYRIYTAIAVSFLKSFVTCFVVHSTSDVHCSVHNIIVILLTRFDAAVPRPHCIVGLVSLWCQMRVKVLEKELKFWTVIHGMRDTI